MRLGLSHFDSDSTYASVGYTPVGAIANSWEPLRYNDVASNALISVTAGINVTLPSSQLVNFAYIANVRGMLLRSSVVNVGTHASPTLTASATIANSSCNDQGDILVAYDSLLNTSSASYTSNLIAVRMATPSASYQLDWSFVAVGKWVLPATALPEINDSFYSQEEKRISLSYRGLTRSDALGLFPNVMAHNMKRVWVLWDNESIFPDLKFKACNLVGYSLGVSAGDVYNAVLTFEVF